MVTTGIFSYAEVKALMGVMSAWLTTAKAAHTFRDTTGSENVPGVPGAAFTSRFRRPSRVKQRLNPATWFCGTQPMAPPTPRCCGCGAGHEQTRLERCHCCRHMTCQACARTDWTAGDNITCGCHTSVTAESTHQQASYTADRFSRPPYQYRTCYAIQNPDGSLRLPNADETERLHGFRTGHTTPCFTSSQAKSDPKGFEQHRLSLLGNTYMVESVAWLFARLAVQLKYLPSILSIADIRANCDLW